MASRGKSQLPELLAEVNARVREIAQASSYAGVEPWDFFCECGTLGCRERVTISLAAMRR
jgi:hypothetical protein